MDLTQLSEKRIRIYRTLVGVMAAAVFGGACTSMPEPKMSRYEFPKDRAFVGDVTRPYTKVGFVRTKVNFVSLDWVHEENQLCRNYYNKAVKDLVARARAQGADAVIDVKSVVYMKTGGVETYATPECSDDGQEGQVLAQGLAVKWSAAVPIKAK